MSGNETNVATITISLDRYEELLESEIRSRIIVDRIYNGDYMREREILVAIGSELALDLVDEMDRKAKAVQNEKRN